MTTNSLVIHTATNTLSDGSEVVDIVLSQYGQQIRLQAVTLSDATDLAVLLKDVINLHTVTDATIDWS